MTGTALSFVPDVEEGAPPVGEHTPTDQFIAWTLRRFADWRMVLTTSFGMEGCALIDMFARHQVPLQVIYLDTGFFFPETHALRDRMMERYPHLEFRNRGTSLKPNEQARIYGADLWQTNPDLCCQLRKVEPMREALADVDVWITSIGRSQSAARAGVQLIEWDWKFHVIKINPLANWDREQVWRYVKANDVPYNDLHDQGYPSIGCTHCTRPIAGVAPHQYTRLGRWSGRTKTECGLHQQPAAG